jgi:hypothetical protein
VTPADLPSSFHGQNESPVVVTVSVLKGHQAREEDHSATALSVGRSPPVFIYISTSLGPGELPGWMDGLQNNSSAVAVV